MTEGKVFAQERAKRRISAILWRRHGHLAAKQVNIFDAETRYTSPLRNSRSLATISSGHTASIIARHLSIRD